MVNSNRRMKKSNKKKSIRCMRWPPGMNVKVNKSNRKTKSKKHVKVNSVNSNSIKLRLENCENKKQDKNLKVWCLKCKSKELMSMKNRKCVVKNNMVSLKGVCEKCGTKMNLIVGLK